MKRILLIIPLCSLMLTACWDRQEINDLAIVTAAAIDKSKDNEIELSIQVFTPRALSGGGGLASGGQAMTLVRTSKGINIADAMSKIQADLPLRVFWGHCKVYIFGEEIAKKGITELIDFFARHPEPRNRAFMYVSKGNAMEVLQLLPPLERYSADVIRELSDLHVGLEITLVELERMLHSRAKAAALPMISILPPEKGSEQLKTIPYLFGTAVFKQGKMIGQISERATRGVMWVRNEISVTTVTVKAKDVKGFVSLNPIRETTVLTPVIEKGKWKINVKIKTEGDLIQNGTRLNLMNPDLMRKMETALREDIDTRIKLALKLVQKELKADILGFATEFHRKYPKEFAAVKDRWDEVFPTIEVKTQIAAYIRRPGLSTGPGGITESEVIQK
jgi:spore germination protein KC